MSSLERGLNLMREVLDAPIASYFTSCVHCGLCADACLFYTETGDPKYTPIHKLEPLRRMWRNEYTLLGRLGAALGLARPVGEEELAAWSELVYDSCTLCGRCSLACPVGNDITGMVRKIREGMAIAGFAPPGVIEAVTRTIELGSPMGIKPPAFLKMVSVEAAESGVEVPIDQAGVDCLVLMSSMEIVGFPEYLGALARIFKQAGVTWTVSSEAFEATNAGIQIGVSDLARDIVLRIVNAAEKLKVKTVISPECGHAFTALRWDGPNLIGRPYPFEVVHVLELLDRLRNEGKLPTEGSLDEPLTFHDPCQIVRRGGVVEEPRYLLNQVASDFREMEDAGIYNWCCGGGGGVSANPRAEALRFKVFQVKKRQLDKLGVKTMVTACANCRNVMEEAIEHYNMDVRVIGLTELVAEHLVESEADKNH
ncbi:MAG: (Fe-S)-binding protein [Sulfuricella sp.]|nr:(Fe-S)-binding protein [Sulfuricella sp.]